MAGGDKASIPRIRKMAPRQAAADQSIGADNTSALMRKVSAWWLQGPAITEIKDAQLHGRFDLARCRGEPFDPRRSPATGGHGGLGRSARGARPDREDRAGWSVANSSILQAAIVPRVAFGRLT